MDLFPLIPPLEHLPSAVEHPWVSSDAPFEGFPCPAATRAHLSFPPFLQLVFESALKSQLLLSECSGVTQLGEVVL